MKEVGDALAAGGPGKEVFFPSSFSLANWGLERGRGLARPFGSSFVLALSGGLGVRVLNLELEIKDEPGEDLGVDLCPSLPPGSFLSRSAQMRQDNDGFMSFTRSIMESWSPRTNTGREDGRMFA